MKVPAKAPPKLLSFKPLLCIVGPTASGKSALALQLCDLLHGEIVSCDSMQIYRGCDIATAKPTRLEQEKTPHHFLDICEPNERFSAAQWATEVRKTIGEIENRGKTPVICGGTGFWLRALLQPEFLSEVAPNSELRQALQAELERVGAAEIHRKLAALDAGAAARLHPNDTFRTLRALEIALQTLQPTAELAPESQKSDSEFAAQIFALDWPREVLYERIDRRVDAMISAGFETELQDLISKWGRDAPALGGVGYKQMLPVFEGESDFEAGVELWKRESRRYAKRQMTYFRHQLPVTWLPGEANASIIVEKMRSQAE